MKIYLLVYSRSGNLLENNVFWDFDILREKLYRKLKIVAYVKAMSKKSKITNEEYFKYIKMEVYLLKNFDIFIDLIETGIIRVNFKLNIETKPEKLGRIHDHGTSFDILEENLNLLYDKM